MILEIAFFLLMVTVTIKIANRIRNTLIDFLFKLFASPEMKSFEYEAAIKRNTRAAASKQDNTIYKITSLS